MYVAVPVMDQGRVTAVVRASLTMAAIDRALNAMYVKIALGGLGAALLAALLSLCMSRASAPPGGDAAGGPALCPGGLAASRCRSPHPRSWPAWPRP